MITFRKNQILASRSRVKFDPTNVQHMLDYADFLKSNNWRHGCPYYLEDPYTDIPTMIQSKIAQHFTTQLLKSA